MFIRMEKGTTKKDIIGVIKEGIKIGTVFMSKRNGNVFIAIVYSDVRVSSEDFKRLPGVDMVSEDMLPFYDNIKDFPEVDIYGNAMTDTRFS